MFRSFYSVATGYLIITLKLGHIDDIYTCKISNLTHTHLYILGDLFKQCIYQFITSNALKHRQMSDVKMLRLYRGRDITVKVHILIRHDLTINEETFSNVGYFRTYTVYVIFWMFFPYRRISS